MQWRGTLGIWTLVPYRGALDIPASPGYGFAAHPMPSVADARNPFRVERLAHITH